MWEGSSTIESMAISPTTRALWNTHLFNTVAVILMILTGIIVLTLTVSSYPGNVDSTGTLTNGGTARFLAGMLMLLLLPGYRKEPLILVLLGILNTGVFLNDPTVVAVGLTVWMIRAKNRADWIVAGCGFAAILFNGIVHFISIGDLQNGSDIELYSITQPMITVTSIGLPLVIAFVIRSHRRVDEATLHVKESQDTLSEERTRQEEREDLAREVHDTLASRLSSIALLAGTMDSPDAERLRQGTVHAMDDLRGLLSSLRREGKQTVPTQEATYNNLKDIQDAIADAESLGLRVSPCTIVVDSYANAPFEIRKGVHRITKEMLANALRHSDDRLAMLTIEGGPGTGIQISTANHYSDAVTYGVGAGKGMVGMKERAHLLGGTSDVEYSEGRFSMKIWIPWPSKANQEGKIL